MAFDLKSISTGKSNRPPRVILLGCEKLGKSTFAAESPDCIFLPVKGEEGIDDLEVAKFPPAMTYDDVKAAITSLIQGEHEFKNFAIDSSSALEPIIHAEVCKRWKVDTIEKVGGGFGKGYAEAVYLWQELTEGLDVLRTQRNMGIFLIGHVSVTQFNDPMTESYSQYEWDVNKKARAVLSRWADSVLFINNKVYTKVEEGGFNKKETKASSTGNRYVYTQSRPTHPGGGRGVYGKLPYEIQIELGHSYQAWIDAITTTSKQTTQPTTKTTQKED